MNILICKENVTEENLMLLKPQICENGGRVEQKDQKDLWRKAT